MKLESCYQTFTRRTNQTGTGLRTVAASSNAALEGRGEARLAKAVRCGERARDAARSSGDEIFWGRELADLTAGLAGSGGVWRVACGREARRNCSLAAVMIVGLACLCCLGRARPLVADAYLGACLVVGCAPAARR